MKTIARQLQRQRPPISSIVRSLRGATHRPGRASPARLHRTEEELDELLERCGEDDPQVRELRSAKFQLREKPAISRFWTIRPALQATARARAQSHQ